jgi:hypothetical protein
MAGKQPRRVRLEVECLERREVPAAVPVTVMSQNLYVGADLVPRALALAAGGSLAAIPATTQFWNNVQATNFRERADAIAREVVANKPALIGLEEVWKIFTGAPDSLWGNPTRANHLELDFLQILQARLKARGLPYRTVNVTPGGETESAAFVRGSLQDIRMQANVAILARQDLRASGAMKLINAHGQTFSGTNDITSGWDSVDVAYGGRHFRFIDTCLIVPPFSQQQAQQARQLVKGPAATAQPVIVVGDSNITNASAANGAYRVFTGAGFKDAWLQTKHKDPGYTWGNQPDLRNPEPLSYAPFGFGHYRFDLVLYRGALQARSMKRVGVLPSERTVSGMWPSDHAGVVATLALP